MLRGVRAPAEFQQSGLSALSEADRQNRRSGRLFGPAPSTWREHVGKAAGRYTRDGRAETRWFAAPVLASAGRVPWLPPTWPAGSS